MKTTLTIALLALLAGSIIGATAVSLFGRVGPSTSQVQETCEDAMADVRVLAKRLEKAETRQDSIMFAQGWYAAMAVEDEHTQAGGT